MKRLTLASLAIVCLLSACSPNPSPSSNPAASVDRVELSPENLTDATWKNGILIQKNGLNGFFVSGDPTKVAPAAGAHLKFAQSGDRVVTEVVVNAPYVNIYVDKPLDPIGDGYPNKVKQ